MLFICSLIIAFTILVCDEINDAMHFQNIALVYFFRLQSNRIQSEAFRTNSISYPVKIDVVGVILNNGGEQKSHCKVGGCINAHSLHQKPAHNNAH